ncbi:hypothetical protein FHT44_005084 [Mycolicibacterium sp. BK634]|uniref:hypothetical protein n=1 Tax=Mycolicibacterium sp. BK634 TaxID=2587099 RepID=UPI00160F9013|nr:hypothetical protein [Mycolicibacterium sp. BK634]MBB3752572.1 hypothetical protein [Mycolicibacterium sp. BK634]
MTVYQYTAYIESDDGPGITLNRVNEVLRAAGLSSQISYTAVEAPAHLQTEGR